MWCKDELGYSVQTGLDNGLETSGYWFTYNDNADGGHSKIVWPVKTGNDFSEDAVDPVVDHCFGLCGAAVLDKGTLNVSPFAGVAFNVAGETYTGPADVADASEWGGICVTYTADKVLNVVMGLSNSVELSLDYDLPYVALSKSTSPTEKCYTWSRFSQKGDKDGESITGAAAAEQLASLRFEIQGETGDSVNFNIIRLRRYVDFDPSDSPSGSGSADDCGDIWCGADGVLQVNVPNVDNDGYWQFWTDESFGGNSTISWPVELGEGNSLLPVIETSNAIAGTAELDDGDMDSSPFVSVGFYLDEKNKDDKDITSWGGICLVYSSTRALQLELVPEDEENVTGYDNYSATILKSMTVEKVDLTWDRFKHGGWGKTEFSLEEATATVSKILIKFMAPSGNTADFAIYSIGRYGTCGD